MSRKHKQPRLWLRPARVSGTGLLTHAAAWFILDRGRQIATGCGELERENADSEFKKYVSGYHPLSSPTLAADRVTLLRSNHIGNVYFITCDRPMFPIKIGFAVDVRVRLKALQGAMPWPINILAKMEGDFQKEKELHRQFQHLRMEGEWFARGDELVSYIAMVKAVQR